LDFTIDKKKSWYTDKFPVAKGEEIPLFDMKLKTGLEESEWAVKRIQ